MLNTCELPSLLSFLIIVCGHCNLPSHKYSRTELTFCSSKYRDLSIKGIPETPVLSQPSTTVLSSFHQEPRSAETSPFNSPTRLNPGKFPGPLQVIPPLAMSLQEEITIYLLSSWPRMQCGWRGLKPAPKPTLPGQGMDLFLGPSMTNMPSTRRERERSGENTHPAEQWFPG